MTRNLRVVFVCQWFQPEPVSQPTWIVDALRARGTDIEVLTGIPNYPSGRVVKGYRAWRSEKEEVDGIYVRRAPLFPSHDASTVGRCLNYASWAVAAAVVGIPLLRRAQATLVYSSPATAALPAMVAKWLFGVPYILLIQDVWPDSVFASGFLTGRRQRLAERILTPFVRATYRGAHHIAVISPGMVELLESRGVPRSKISVVYNWVEESEVRSTSVTDLRRQIGAASSDFVVMYAGNHGPAQALEKVIEAFAGLPESSTAHLVLIGDGMSKQTLMEMPRGHAVDRVHFLQPVPRSEMTGLMEQADAQLVALARQPLFAVTTPSKLQSALAAGHPVLVAADGDAASIVTSAGAGLAAPAEDVQALRYAIMQMAVMEKAQLRKMGDRARHLYRDNMSADVGAGRLAAVLNAAASTNRRNRT